MLARSFVFFLILYGANFSAYRIIKLMEITLLIILLIAVVILGILILRQKPSNELVEWLKSTGNRLEFQSKSINARLDNATNVISAVQRNIGEMSEIGRGMKDLQQFLNSPKLRGNIGEQVLKELLGQMLPKALFNLQYAFKSGEKVDAAIKTSAGIIPIDSKFPMENFRKMSGEGSDAEKKVYAKDFVRDVKSHIDSISRKYILTEEGTIDYALMYIPSESVYYEIVNNQDLFDYASAKRILPVSPTTFYAYIKAILMSFEGQKIEAQAKEILSSLRAIQKDYSKVDEALAVLQKHVVNSYNTINSVTDAFGKLGQKISNTSSLGESTKEKEKELE
jgi:DNA recombination protein RmuC